MGTPFGGSRNPIVLCFALKFTLIWPPCLPGGTEAVEVGVDPPLNRTLFAPLTREAFIVGGGISSVEILPPFTKLTERE